MELLLCRGPILVISDDITFLVMILIACGFMFFLKSAPMPVRTITPALFHKAAPPKAALSVAVRTAALALLHKAALSKAALSVAVRTIALALDAIKCPRSRVPPIALIKRACGTHERGLQYVPVRILEESKVKLHRKIYVTEVERNVLCSVAQGCNSLGSIQGHSANGPRVECQLRYPESHPGSGDMFLPENRILRVDGG